MSSSFTTPEEHLARSIRKEFRKKERDEYKRTSRQSFTGHPGVRFAEPVIVVDPRGSYLPSYVVTTPGTSVMFGGYGSSFQPSFQPSFQSSQSSSRPSSSSNGGYYTSVPSDLAARGIKAAVEKPRYKPSGPEQCGVLGCRINHSNHFCNVCGNWNVKHSEDDCPLYKNRRY